MMKTTTTLLAAVQAAAARGDGQATLDAVEALFNSPEVAQLSQADRLCTDLAVISEHDEDLRFDGVDSIDPDIVAQLLAEIARRAAHLLRVPSRLRHNVRFLG
jgi:hypothetical protein